LCSDIINTKTGVSNVIAAIEGCPTSPPSLYIDLEGVNLCRLGSISILQLRIHPANRTYLFDIHVLGDLAFSTPGGSESLTLRDIFESPTIPKAFFDLRNDSDALFSHFQVSLAGIHDIQLMELATRSGRRKFLHGLSKCIEKDGGLKKDEKSELLAVKEKGLNLFAPERGGSYEVFNTRPIDRDIVAYCVQDVAFLPVLWKHYHDRLTPEWARKVEIATEERIVLSQSASYEGKGEGRALGPAGWV
jgi:exonuclease 3'-5' domain-containing protein 1